MVLLDIFELTFDALGKLLGPPWDALGSRPLKTSRQSLFTPHFETFWGNFFMVFAYVFSVCFQHVRGQLFSLVLDHFRAAFGEMSPLS